MNLTATQQQAITARGNVLVVAGAGTGKTCTLVERCLNCVLEEKPPASLDEILMVTFTEAAAAEMRQRIRARLEEELKQAPGNERWLEQLALFETAHIGTLHSFCLQLVRQHFYELELDPQLTVLAEEEARLLADETLETLLQAHYAGQTRAGEAVQQLIQAQGRGWDQPIRALVLRLHHYTQTLPDPAGWLRQQLASFAAPEPVLWREWLLGALADWRDRWLPLLTKASPQNALAAQCAAALEALSTSPARAAAAAALESITAAARDCPRGQRTDSVKPLKEFLAEAQFLLSLTRVNSGVDPLTEDWNWVRSQMTTLLQLAAEFKAAFTEAKRELGVVDFHDLEQYALQLLWDSKAGQPTPIAQQWRRQIRFVFVDEYQDINAAQDKIIQALSREDAQANRFLVGDVKQSIYRFRLANPYIFQGYARTWRDGRGQAIPLLENFRSREGLLHFINSLFDLVMQPPLGSLSYDAEARLQFGAPAERGALGLAANPAPCVELHLRVKSGANAPAGDEETNGGLAELLDLEEADKEARLVALQLRELKAQQFPVWDEQAKGFRPVAWSDMAILLRAPANKAESYAKEFARLHVPLLVARGGFYESLEISDLLSLLQLLDNPLQDLPVLAVLHSPLVGLTLDELATIRLTAKGHFWTALVRWREGNDSLKSQVSSLKSPNGLQSHVSSLQSGDSVRGGLDRSGPDELERLETGDRRLETEDRITPDSPLATKVRTFLDRFARWRRLARQVSLSRCLEAVLAETHYAAWLLTLPRGEQRHANVQRLLSLAQQFDQFQRQGLFRFLRFIEAQQLAQTEPEVAPVSEENSVRLLSIHQSKGLEFPVVVVADLAKPFNVSDQRAEIILDEEYGLCPRIKPPHTGQRYPSLPHWLAQQRQHREMLGEELRLLYVAMTRARDRLILSGSVAQSRFDKLWKPSGEAGSTALSAARSYADWLGFWFAQKAGADGEAALQGEMDELRWTIHDDAKLIARGEPTGPAEDTDAKALALDPALAAALQQRLSWAYPSAAATRQPAKTSVSALRRLALLGDEEAPMLFGVQGSRFKVQGSRFDFPSEPARSPARASAADIGTAHHSFLQLVSLEATGSVDELKQEAKRLRQAEALSAEEIALLDFPGLAAFWNSDLGRKVRAQASCAQRELAFTARFAPNELARLTGGPREPNLDEEFVVVQGVADLAVVLPQEIWLVDFKTDSVGPAELAEKVSLYKPQLKLYARALAQIYRRPVSECWLYFLACRKAVAVGPEGAGSEERGA